MSFPVVELSAAEFPRGLSEIPQPPKELRYRGRLPSPELKLLTIVGSRKYTSYGKQVVEELVNGLRDYPVGIISGLALGIDSLAHEAALKNGLYTLAIPGGGINDEVIYPSAHKPLARRILEAGGGLMTEYAADFRATKWSFVQRNRLVCGISHATLMIEAAEQSGTLTTARMAVDYNRDLLVVPGSIFSKQHFGIHQFLKLGATPVTTSEDILEVLGIDTKVESQPTLTDGGRPALSLDEQKVLAALHEPLSRDELIRQLNLETSQATQLLMLMELAGHIAQDSGIYRAK